MTPSIIFDFDGTLAVGHGPVLSYARLAAPAAQPHFLERVEAELGKYDAGETDYRDGYDIVAALAAEDGVDQVTLSAAYTGSRQYLGTDVSPVHTVPGLDDLLAAVNQYARLILVTNAPRQGMDRVLDSWRLRELFDEVYFDVGKPEGLGPIVAKALADGPVLAIGDIVEHDLAPAIELGADTALVGAAAATSTAEVTMRGRSLTELQAEIRSWAVSRTDQES